MSNRAGIFAFDWDSPVSEEERDQMLAGIAEKIRKRGLETPAIWFLEVHKPLAPLGGQFAVVLSPFLASLLAGGAFDLQKYVKVMENTANVERLIRLLDDHQAPAANSGHEAAAA